MSNMYAIEIREETRALATFLNDGVEVPLTEDDPHVLFCEINSPTEIATKVLTPRDLVLHDIPDGTLYLKK